MWDASTMTQRRIRSKLHSSRSAQFALSQWAGMPWLESTRCVLGVGCGTSYPHCIHESLRALRLHSAYIITFFLELLHPASPWVFFGHLINNETLPGLCICWVWTAWGCPACPRPDEWDSRLWQEHQGNKIISTFTLKTNFVTSRRTT